jgi:hypothetical protein
MGFRTVVVLYNDHCSEWQNDPELGRKIIAGMNHTHEKEWGNPSDLRYGRVVECEHADTQTVAVLDSYSFTPLAYSFWRRDEKNEDRNVRLLKELADKLGYRVIKKPPTRRTPT